MEVSHQTVLWPLKSSKRTGSPDHAAYLVQRFLKTFRPRACWSLTDAVTCSKPRPGAFGGGALFVTAESIEPLHAHAFIDARRAAFDTLQQLSCGSSRPSGTSLRQPPTSIWTEQDSTKNPRKPLSKSPIESDSALKICKSRT